MKTDKDSAVNETHPEYDAALFAWSRARDVIAGEDAIKAAGEKYLPRLESQSSEEYAAYKARAAFFNATARTAEGYLGLVFRRPPLVKLPEASTSLGKALTDFNNDADMLGTSLPNYAKNVVTEVLSVGRAGTLIDWEDDVEDRAFVSFYATENILNWQVERINGRNVLTRIVLNEHVGDTGHSADGSDEQIRVLKLVENATGRVDGQRQRNYECHVEIWRPEMSKSGAQKKRGKTEWKMVETRVPLRLGKPLPLIPFVFHGSRNSLPTIDKLPMADVIAVNLDHYRLDADYKHGMHFTALPTAWVSGFDKNATLRIGASTAWVTETPGATAGFLEYTGQGLTTFERAMDRDERLMAVLGARLLESQKKVGETSEAIELRQTGEHSILATITNTVSASLTHVLRWVYWWNSTEEFPDDVTREQVHIELNTDFSTKGLSAQEITAIVTAWQQGALSRDSMLELFRRNEILPEGRSNEEETALSGMRPTLVNKRSQSGP